MSTMTTIPRDLTPPRQPRCPRHDCPMWVVLASDTYVCARCLVETYWEQRSTISRLEAERDHHEVVELRAENRRLVGLLYAACICEHCGSCTCVGQCINPPVVRDGKAGDYPCRDCSHIHDEEGCGSCTRNPARHEFWDNYETDNEEMDDDDDYYDVTDEDDDDGGGGQ